MTISHLALWLAAAALALAMPARAEDSVRYFRIGTAATTGTYFQIGGVLAAAISKPPGSRSCQDGGGCGVDGLIAVAQATQGSIENAIDVASGQLESGFVQSDIARWAYEGSAPASPRCRGKQTDPNATYGGTQLLATRGAMSNLRVIAALYPEDVQIVVRADGKIHALADLKGKRLGVGEAQSGTLVDARIVLAAAGLGPCDVTSQYFRLARAAEALASGELDGFLIVAGPPVPAVSEVAALVPARIVPIGGPPLTQLMGHPPFFRADTIAGGTYPGLAEPTDTVSVTALWVVNAETSDDLVYAITRALWQETTRRLLDFAHPAGRRIHIETAVIDSGVPLHPGAARYYKELGLEVPPAR